MKSIFRIISLLLIAALFLTACKKDEAEEPEVTQTPAYTDEVPVQLESFTYTPDNFPRIGGSPGTAPLAQALTAVMLGITREDAENPAMFTGVTHAYRSLAAGHSDIIIAGEPGPGLQSEISSFDFRYESSPVALDALVFIVSKSNPVDNLTSEQVRAIYAGGLTNWHEAGGSDAEITAFQRNEEAASRILMEMLVMDWETMADAPMQTVLPDHPMYGDDSALTAIKGFDGSAGAIGYTMYYYAANMGMADGYKILSVDGIMPGAGTIESGEYPFISPYYAVISSDLPEDDSTRILYNWLLSDEGRELIGMEGYVPAAGRDADSDADGDAVQMRWAVTADFTKLEQQASTRSKFMRLREGELPGLETQSNYGQLLPFSASVTMNDGSIHAVRYGFVTEQTGIVITDPVYDGIERAAYTTQAGDIPLPAYRLHMNLPEGDPDYGYRTIQAACASDGSWMTPLIYENVIFRENIIFLMRSEESFDIDVYDYNGNMLYNVLETEWAGRISEDSWPWHLIRSESDGYSFIKLDEDIWAVLDVRTGRIRETDFADVFTFSEGLACVRPAGGTLWGFIDENLDIVIAPGYTSESAFIDGRAIVEKQDLVQYVIDRQGDVLYTVPEGYLISSLSDGLAYRLFSTRSAEFTGPVLLDYYFNEIKLPPDALPLDPESFIQPLRGGWFSCMTENGSWIFSIDGHAYALPPSVVSIADSFSGLTVYTEYDPDSGIMQTGVIDQGGRVIAAPAAGQSVSLAVGSWMGGVTGVMVNTDFGIEPGLGFDTYTPAVYSLLDPYNQANTVKSGPGIISFDEIAGLFYVQGTDYFAWLSAAGDTLISIPSMAYLFD